MASKKTTAPPPPSIQFNPTTLAVLAATLLIGIVVGYVIGKGASSGDDAGTVSSSASSSATPAPGHPDRPPKDRPAHPRAAAARSDSPFLDADALAKFEGKETELKDYRKAVDFVDRRNARAASPILDRLSTAGAPYEEEVSLLSAANKVNQNVPQQALDQLATWRSTYPDSRLKAQADLIEGKAHEAMGRAKQGAADVPAGEAKAELEKARDIFIEVSKAYSDDQDACAEAMYNLASVYGRLGDQDRSLETYDQLVERYPDHSLAPRGLYMVANDAWRSEDYDTARAYFQKLVERYPDDGLSKRSRKNITALEIIGKDAPELQVSHYLGSGGEVGVADSRGKVVLLAFWNEWCPHCRREVPKLQELYEKYADQGLVVIAVTKHTKSQNDDKVSKFLADNHITFPCAVESEGYQSTKDYGVSGVPAAVVIDRKGKIVWRNHPARLTEERLARFLSD